jgi:hypothetical protein
MKNKLSLKVLKQEIERLKASKDSSIKKDIGHDIKHSYINKLYTKSSALWLYILTGVLGYAHRIPYIGRIISLLSLWYGRTTIWKILIKIRKVFIVFNAIIGVYIVFKSVGFSTDNLIGGVYGVGHTYLETFYRMTKKLFYWFVELFDHKIIPNLPGGDIPDYPKNLPLPINNYKYPQPRLYDFSDSAVKSRDIFGFFDTVELHPKQPWYKDSSTLYWILGLTCAISVCVLGYKMIVDPTILDNLLGNKTIPKGGGAAGPSINVEDTSETASRSERALGKMKDTVVGVINLPGRITGAVINKLNPFNYVVSASDLELDRLAFMYDQSHPSSADIRYYPFTTDNPYDSWFTKLKKHYVGESVSEGLQRIRDRGRYDVAYRAMTGGGAVETLFSAAQSISHTGVNTPSLSNVGLKSPGPTGFVEALSTINTERKLASIPGTPNLVPDWTGHEPIIDADSESFMERLDEKKRLERQSASKISYSWTKTAPIIPSVTDNTAAPSYAEALRSAASNSQGGNFPSPTR